MDSRKNVIAELATIFWVPKSLVSFQLQELVTESRTPGRLLETTSALDTVQSA